MYKKKIYTLIYYCSIAFLIVYLTTSEKMSFHHINFNYNLAISIFFLTAGFFTYPLVLDLVLRYQGITSNYLSCFTALGKTVFSKYIPGKAAMVYAIAYNLNKNENSTGIARLSYNVLVFQVLIIISGLLTGLFSVIRMGNIPVAWKVGSAVMIIISLYISTSEIFFSKISIYLSKRLGKDIKLTHFKKKNVLLIILLSAIFWILWGTGMYFLVLSSEYNVAGSHSLIFLFSFSVCVGIVAIIAPGGIGIREGVLAMIIVSLGNPVKTAAEISVLSRLWFVTGEIVLFLISHIVSYKTNRITLRNG